MKNCPFCAEEVQDAAIKCKYCSEWIKLDNDCYGKSSIGQALKSIRKKRNITLQKMSDLSGIQLATLSRMENNKVLGCLKNYVCIAKSLGMKLSELFTEIEK